MIYPWPFPCPVCYAPMLVDRDIITRGTGKRTVDRIYCQTCGASVVNRREYEPGDELGPTQWAAICRERQGYYKNDRCLVCGFALTGRQKLYCSDRCRKRYSRTKPDNNPDKAGHNSP